MACRGIAPAKAGGDLGVATSAAAWEQHAAQSDEHLDDQRFATLQAFRALRPIAGSSSPVQMLERFESGSMTACPIPRSSLAFWMHADAGCGARAGRGPVAR